MSATRPVPWIMFSCLLATSCARGEPPSKRPAIPVVTIPYADEMPRETYPPEPDPYPNGDTRSPEDRWMAATSANRANDIQCVYHIVGDTQVFSRRILALAEAWRRGIGNDSIEMSCYILRIVPPELP